MMNKLTILSLILSVVLMSACEKPVENTESNITASIDNLFELKSIAECGIDFNNTIINNTIIENDTLNYLLVEAMIVGAGVGVVDINNDGLLDVFFAGNMVSDKLYLNKGNLEFEDITKSAGIENDTWSTAITFADVNNDGWQDIYVGKFIYRNPDKRRNFLYINNQDNTFTESAAQYGIDHNGHCSAANFFDYDQDGDLDLYLGIQPFVQGDKKYNKDLSYNPDDYSDVLYRNDGGKFEDVTVEAGLKFFNYTLSATVGDFNHDGWPDLYVASDYEEPDCYYINKGDGTFDNQVNTAMRHISNFSMGADVADFNNDGWIDIVTADMAPEDNYRSKANMSGMNPKRFWALADNGFHYQYMFNTLQLNNGNGTFSEIGHMAGMAQTDWSWSTLFGDYDLDGDKDLLITNGHLYDVRNKDFLSRVKIATESVDIKDGMKPQTRSEKIMTLVDQAPQEPLANYLFINDNNLQFTNKAATAGMHDKTFSQGAAYADLDNDGDLDLLLNNLNERAFLYENHANEQSNNHYLSVKLNGSSPSNAYVYGAKVWVFTEKGLQVQEVNPVRGYMSSSDPVLTFGLGLAEKVDRLVVQWPEGKVTELKGVEVDQRLELNQNEGVLKPANIYRINAPVFKNVTNQSEIQYAHKENNFDDYKDEVLIPHRMSRLGPASAKADVNGDGLEDVFLGGAAGQAGTLFLQQADQTFIPSASQPWEGDAKCEDVHAHFFDMDNDGDEDIYITSGGNEFSVGAIELEDRLYQNTGNGAFVKSNQIPEIRTSGGVATSGDIDGDGDLDLFIGGRQVPGKYGHPAQSFVLRNNNGQFEDISDQVGIDFKEFGMVTDAVWTDLDNDKDQDLIVVGEWMPIKILINEKGILQDQTKESGLDKTNGWWNRITLADMDNDGDQDIIAGNLGLNIKFKASLESPFTAFVKDFDENGSNDVYLAYYDTKGNMFPVRGRQCSSEELPYITEEFSTYHEFAQATAEEVLGDRIQDAIKLEAFQFQSIYLENNGQTNFTIHQLPTIAQSFPVFGIIPQDLNKDGHLDLLLAGNYYEREVETTRSDAGIGLVLLGDGQGAFKPMPTYETGLLAYFDVKNLLMLENKGEPVLMVVNNNKGVQVYQYK